VSWHHQAFLDEKIDWAKGRQGNIRKITIIKLKQHTPLCAHKMLGIYFSLKKASFSPHILYTHVYNIYIYIYSLQKRSTNMHLSAITNFSLF
jgi:hypothetical protein